MILTDARVKRMKEIQRSLETLTHRLAWRGSQKRVFIIAEGLFRNRIRLLGPDSKFSGLEGLITTGKSPDGTR